MSPLREPVGAGRYLMVTVVLLLLTVVNVGLAHVPLGGWNTAIALAIAASEVALMALFFMHLRWSLAITRLAGVAALLWLAILIVGTLDDVLTRGWLPAPGK
jgi:cytochrome c oxidase subunit 4